MALTAPQITELVKDLGKRFKSNIKSVVYNAGKGKITLLVATADAGIRRKLLQAVQKTYAGAPWNARYSPPDRNRTGAVRMGNVQIEAKDSIQQSSPALKPSDIVPAITNVWIDAATMVKNVSSYIMGLDLTDADKKDIIELVKLTAQNTKNQINIGKIDVKLVSAEFFEILTSLKLAVLLKANDANIIKILGLPKDLVPGSSKIKIKIPKEANYPLVDYFIYIGDGQADDSASMKISVKSKVTSAQTNTVKFPSMFKGTSVDSWYKDLPAKIKPTQKGQKAIATGIMQSYNLPNYVTKGPILALQNLIKSDRTRIEPFLSQNFGIKNISEFTQVLDFALNASTITTTRNFEFGSDIKTPAKQLKIINNFISQALEGSSLQAAARPTWYAFTWACERVLINSSKPKSSTKYNFYQMFYDEVLKRQHVAYAVSTYDKGILKYDFYSAVNWKSEYKRYLALRTKNTANAMAEAVGLDV